MKRSASTTVVIAERREGLRPSAVGRAARRLAATCLAASLLSAAVAAGVASAAPAGSPAPGWVKEDSVGAGGAEPRVVLSGEGGAVAVWESQLRGRYVIEGAVRVDGAWKAGGVLGADAFEPSLAAGPEGGAIAVWDGPRGVEAATATPAGGWSRLPSIRGTSGAFAPEIATDAGGRATVVWRQPGPGHTTIDVATLAPSGGWSAARRLSRPGHPAFSPHLAIAPSGAAAVVWRRYDGERSIVQAAVRDPAGHWSSSVDLSAAGENAVSPAVAIDPAGEAIAVWDRFDGANQIIQVATHPASGRWSSPVDLSARGRNAESPKVALSSTGEAVAVWERFDGRIDRIQAAVRLPAGSWPAPRNLSPPTPLSSHEPSLAIDAGGLARVVWAATESHGGAIAEASRPAGGSWSGRATIIEGPTVRREPTIAAAGDGEAVVVWAGYGIGAAFHPPGE